jgi:hypothetical protein
VGESGNRSEARSEEEPVEGRCSKDKELWLFARGSFSAVLRCLMACMTAAGVPDVEVDEVEERPLILDEAITLEDGAVTRRPGAGGRKR